MLYMARKCLCDGNDDNYNGDDDVKISFYKIFKGIMIDIELRKDHEYFKKACCCKLPCRKLLLVAHA